LGEGVKNINANLALEMETATFRKKPTESI
jgi:hypothetical protein